MWTYVLGRPRSHPRRGLPLGRSRACPSFRDLPVVTSDLEIDIGDNGGEAVPRHSTRRRDAQLWVPASYEVTRSTSPIAVASSEGTTWFGVQHRQVSGRRHRTDVRDAACAVAPRLRGRPVAAVACQTRHRCQHLGCCGRQWAGIAGSDVSPEIYSVRLAKWGGVGAVDRGVGDAASQNQDAGSCPDADLYSGLLELISMALKTRRLC